MKRGAGSASRVTPVAAWQKLICPSAVTSARISPDRMLARANSMAISASAAAGGMVPSAPGRACPEPVEGSLRIAAPCVARTRRLSAPHGSMRTVSCPPRQIRALVLKVNGIARHLVGYDCLTQRRRVAKSKQRVLRSLRLGVRIIVFGTLYLVSSAARIIAK
jgi:hypothetical protein